MPRIQEEDADARHLQSLRAAVNATLREYLTFIARDAPEEAGKFAARHAAGKAAVGHLTVLSKLLQWSRTVSSSPRLEESEPMDELLAAARAAMSHYDDGAENDA